MTMPKGCTLWADSHGWDGSWKLDAKGNCLASEDEGTRDVV